MPGMPEPWTGNWPEWTWFFRPWSLQTLWTASAPGPVGETCPSFHDRGAYAISSSKLSSEVFFRRQGIPIPATWPGCRFPVIAKPSFGSGSQGIRRFASAAALRAALGEDPASAGWIVQSFLSGPTHSIEVIGRCGRFQGLQVTDLYMDAHYDCKRVTAPSALTPFLQAPLVDLALKMAAALGLEGIMDVEAVRHDGSWYVLEIDARFPSQTPIAVFTSTLFNMVEGLVRRERGGDAFPVETTLPAVRGAVLEHIRVAPGTLEVTGEHALATAGPLRAWPDFFGAGEALTDYALGKDRWVVTLICSGANLEAAWERRRAAVSAIRRRFGLESYRDPWPLPDAGGTS